MTTHLLREQVQSQSDPNNRRPCVHRSHGSQRELCVFTFQHSSSSQYDIERIRSDCTRVFLGGIRRSAVPSVIVHVLSISCVFLVACSPSGGRQHSISRVVCILNTPIDCQHCDVCDRCADRCGSYGGTFHDTRTREQANDIYSMGTVLDIAGYGVLASLS